MSEEKNLFDKKFLYLEWNDELKGKKVLAGDNLQFMRRDVNDGTVKFRCVEDYRRSSSNINSDLYPFKDENGTAWSLVYYDPNYSCKLAYAQGKVIQCKHIEGSTWSDCTVPPSWLDDYEYRVKPEEEFHVYKSSDETLHLSKWCTAAGSIFDGTEDECRQYIKEHYCDRCSHQSCDMVVGTQFCKGFKEVKKRRMTNREFAKWLAEGNGQARDTRTVFTFTYYNMYAVSDDDKPCPSYLVIRGWDETEWREPIVEG